MMISLLRYSGAKARGAHTPAHRHSDAAGGPPVRAENQQSCSLKPSRSMQNNDIGSYTKPGTLFAVEIHDSNLLG